MSVLDKISDRATYSRRYDEFVRPAPHALTLTTAPVPRETNDFRTFGVKSGYEMTLTLKTRYWLDDGTPAQRPEVVAEAKRSLVSLLFSDMLPLISELRYSISAGDAAQAMKLAGELRHIATGGEIEP